MVGVSLVDVQWIPGAITGELPLGAPLTSMNAIVAEVLRQTVKTIPGWRGQFVPGDYGISANGMTWQMGVDLMLSDLEHTNGVSPIEHVEPLAALLANEIETKRLTRFGARAMSLPCLPVADSAVATDAFTGITVSGMRRFDVEEMQGCPWRYRFDVLGNAA